MAKTNEDTEKQETILSEGKAEPELVSIEEMQKMTKISIAVYYGVCAAEGWTAGKMVTPDQFNTAVAKYLRSPMGR